MNIHPLRSQLYDELHSRPFHVIPSPARVTQIALLCSEADKRAQYEHLKELNSILGCPIDQADQNCYEYDCGSFRLRREKHTEFTTYTFINLDVPADADPFEVTGLTPIPEAWVESIPGEIVAAFHVAIEDARQGPEPELPIVKQAFEEMRLVGSSPQNGDARVWTSFQLHSDGFGRLMVVNKHMSDSQLGRLTQRLMEIETYRLMALLSLPMARSVSPELVRMDDRLADLTQKLSEEESVNEQALLSDLIEMASSIESWRARSTFRFSATQAYHELVLTRLEELREDEVSGHLTITEFMTRRLTPAVRTCQASSKRLEDLSRRVDRVSDMMRTRVELGIHQQNQQLLSSMDRRSRIQLMMQHTVEGLSVVAISYYLVGLLKFLFIALYDAGVPLNKTLATGLSVPVVLLTVWLVTRRIHHHFIKLARKDTIGADKP
ncbi:DUF3422 domain-containing protein [Marinobacterium sp. AK62]|uniref:DUF3422 domain-containing protein n=1 Tax=Marinobacterium alkalitolerans TaxID=1542925 RepID=A0ABS3ZEU1_9GAMM|nr:DUF3422 domain-containing protein [Marinobacterium alkalitolerans]MBP0050131.1 DUF3422 domain-containing protein [Marinobacterium alkalitolerans]